jgi:hypothetical protein
VRLGEKGDFGPLFLICRKLLILFEFFLLRFLQIHVEYTS